MKRAGADLTILLRASETQAVSPDTRGVVPNMPQAVTLATDSAKLEEALRVNDLLRQRVAELDAKKLMAENRLLSDELSAQQARLVESRQEAARLLATLDQLEVRAESEMSS